MQQRTLKYSVLMSVYKNDNAVWLREAVDSMLSQSIPPSEYVVVKDGPIPNDIQSVLDDYQRNYPGLFVIVSLDRNVGLGEALAKGVLACSNEYVARMDSDDVSMPTRCEEILKELSSDDSLDMVGCFVDEFCESTDNVVSHVVLPISPEETCAFAKRRVPIRHSSVIFKKSAVLEVGNYNPIRRSQDYDLVVRMLLAGKKIANVPKTLLFMRVDEDFYIRRGGIDKARLLAGQRKTFRKYGFYGPIEWRVYALANIAVCMMPNGLRTVVYKKLLRR